jgi:hypothetical protein
VAIAHEGATIMKRILLAGLAAAALGLAAAPASSQGWGPPGYGYGGGGGYGGGYGGGGGYRGGYDEDDDVRVYRRRGDGYGQRRFGSTCVTARGNCPARPSPHGTPCGCNIPGFGLKRGAVY